MEQMRGLSSIDMENLIVPTFVEPCFQRNTKTSLDFFDMP